MLFHYTSVRAASRGGRAMHKAHEEVKKAAGRELLVQDAVRLLSALLSALDRYCITPQKMGLLVTGLQLVCVWRYLAVLVEGFDARGFQCLWEMWGLAVVAVVVGQIAKFFTPSPSDECDEDLEILAPEHSTGSGSSIPAPIKEGQELSYPTAAAGKAGGAAGALEQDDQEDDVATAKRRAQEEAADKLAKYRADVQQLLASISREVSGSSSSVVSAQLLFRLADQLFASPVNLSEFVSLGGVTVVVAAVSALARTLGASLKMQEQQQRTSPQQQQQQQEIEEVQQPLPQQQQEVEALQAAAIPALLQASWVLLQLSQGAPACRSALHDLQCSAALLSAAQAVTALPHSAARAAEPVLRNIWWTLLSLCDKPATRGSTPSGNQQRGLPQQQPSSLSDSADSCKQQLLLQYKHAGAVQMLHRLLGLHHGTSPGWVAAAQLGLLLQLGHEQQQQQQQQQQVELVASDLASSAVQAVLQSDSITGLCYLMMQLRLEQTHPPQEQQQQQLSGRMRVLVEGMLHYLLTFHSPQLLQLLIEQQLLGCFAAHSCTRLGRLLVCQLLSSKGQEMMAAVEEGYELDVPLALAQIIPLKLHVRLPQAPAPPAPHQQQQVATFGEIEPLQEGQLGEQLPQQQQQQAAAAAQQADDVYTDVLACRLLLQHQRLWELLVAMCDELQTPLPQQQQQEEDGAVEQAAAQSDFADREFGVVPAAFGLIHHLMSRDLQLQAAKHVRGDCVSDSLSGTSSSSKSFEEALAMPDRTGTYSKVLDGMVPNQQLPAGPAAVAAAAASSSSSSAAQPLQLTLPELEGAAPLTAAAGSSSQVVFRFGELEHAVNAPMFKKIKHCSKLVHSILSRVHISSAGAECSSSSAAQQQPEAVTVLTIPQFTAEANLWVLQCLERWLSTKALSGFNVMQAAKLWVAADFLQVDDLQVACEDLIATGFKQDPQHMRVALELCARHVESGGRLLRLLVQEVLRMVSTCCSAGPGSGQGAGSVVNDGAERLQQQQVVQMLQQLLEQHTGVLLPVIHAELRDRLVALCMLTAGLDADDPLDVVG